jgi:hypothetical protein
LRNGGYSYRGVSVMEYVATQITFPLFAHEGLHQYLHHHVRTPHIPAWLNEGLAVYCEGQRWGYDPDRNYRVKSFDPWYNPARRNQLADALLSDRLYSLRQLLRTHAGEVVRETSRAVQTYYAQVWALTLFLQHGADGKYAEGFARLLQDIGTTDLEQRARAVHIWSEERAFHFGEALFRSYISEDLDTVEQEYRGFMRERFLAAR